MMEYRVVTSLCPYDDRTAHEICAVYSDEQGICYTESAEPLVTSDADEPGIDGLRKQMERMQEAFSKPLLIQNGEGCARRSRRQRGLVINRPRHGEVTHTLGGRQWPMKGDDTSPAPEHVCSAQARERRRLMEARNLAGSGTTKGGGCYACVSDEGRGRRTARYTRKGGRRR